MRWQHSRNLVAPDRALHNAPWQLTRARDVGVGALARAQDAIREDIEDEHRRSGLRIGESRATRRADALVAVLFVDIASAFEHVSKVGLDAFGALGIFDVDSRLVMNRDGLLS